MKNKIAVVTGASTPLGSAIVEKLLLAEYDVIAHINEKRGDLVNLLDGQNSLDLVRQDLSDESGARHFIDQIGKRCSHIDVLVNTIGPMVQKDIWELTPKEWQSQIHFNLNLVFYLSYYAKTCLSKDSGHIINFAFSGAEYLKARMDSTAYCAAKAGVVVLTKSLASAFARLGVRVNAISPGLIEAGEPVTDERRQMAHAIPLGRPGLPSEVAEVLLWLVTKSPKYLTGSIVSVAGGWEYC